MKPWLAPAGLMLLLGLLLPATGRAQPSFADYYRDAVTAYRSGDGAAFVDAARAARASRPDSPQAAYLLAAALANAGDARGSLDLLEELAGQGLQFEPGKEAAFASIGLEQQAPALLERFQSNGAPVGEAKRTFALADGRFVPEGIAWDERRQRFLLGSIHQRRVVSVDRDGQPREFIASGQDGLLSVFGMQVDAAADSLWLATSGLRESGDIPDHWLGRAGIMQFGLASAKMLAVHWLPEDDREHVLGDLAILPDGRVLTSDSLTGEVLRLDPGAGAFEVLVPAGTLVSPQGLVVDSAGKFAWVADYRGGIFRLSLADGRLRKVAEGGTTHHGIDGLYRWGDWLVGVQNGVQPNRVVALKLDATGLVVQRYEVLAAALPEFDDPNLGVIVGGRLHFNANSHWPQFDEEGKLPDGLRGPVVLSVALPGEN